MQAESSHAQRQQHQKSEVGKELRTQISAHPGIFQAALSHLPSVGGHVRTHGGVEQTADDSSPPWMREQLGLHSRVPGMGPEEQVLKRGEQRHAQCQHDQRVHGALADDLVDDDHHGHRHRQTQNLRTQSQIGRNARGR